MGFRGSRVQIPPSRLNQPSARSSIRRPGRRAPPYAGTLPFRRRWRATCSARNTFINDWYGTSRSLARALSSSSSGTGRRMEMAAVDGRRSGRAGRTARLQSKWSAVSCFAQKRRSWSSFAKRGGGFRAARLALLMDPPFASSHGSGRDDPDQRFPDREDDGQPARCVGLSQGGVTWLSLRVFDVWRDEEWAVEKHLLELSLV